MDRIFRIRKYAYKSIFLIVCLIAITNFLHILNSGVGTYIVKDLDEEWRVYLNGEVYENVTLSNFSFDVLGKNDVIILQNKVPSINVQNVAMRFWLCHATMDVFLDNQLIYSYGKEYKDQNELTGSGYHFVEFPDYAIGKNFTILINVTENDAFSSFEKIYFAKTRDLFKHFLNERFYSIVVGIFLVTLGIVGMIFLSILYEKGSMLGRLINIFVFSVCVGMWGLCNIGAIQLICKNLIIPQKIEYITLYFATIPILLFSYDLNRDILLIKRIISAFLIVLVVFNVTCNVLQIFEIMHYNQALPFFQGMLCFIIVCMIAIFVYDFVIGKKEVSAIIFGVFIIAIGVFIDLLSFYQHKYFPNFNLPYIKSASLVSSLILVACMFGSYCIYVHRLIENQTKMVVLKNLAYRDILTGIYNRTWAEQENERLNSAERKNPYTIIFFDLNGLKQVNDTMGHDKGDELLQAFSQVLERVFSDYGNVCRIGGDEYIVFIYHARKKEIMSYIHELKIQMDNMNKKLDKIKLDTAYGIAYSIEKNEEFDTWKLADTRMYQMKKEMKSKTQ